MRFRFQATTFKKQLYSLRFGQHIVDIDIVRNWSSTQTVLHWVWPDGAEYFLKFPALGTHSHRTWQLLQGDTLVASARLAIPTFKDSIFKTPVPYIVWNVGGREFTCARRRCCLQCLCDSEGRRIAVWCPRLCRVEGVWNDRLREPSPAILFGMILSFLHRDD